MAGKDAKAPWHFKLLMVLLAIYLGWRLVQLVAARRLTPTSRDGQHAKDEQRRCSRPATVLEPLGGGGSHLGGR